VAEGNLTSNEGGVECPSQEVETMKDLRCLVGWHRFITAHSEDGTAVSGECSRCGKYMPDFRVGGTGFV
jgi:hypothetical protein